MSKSTRQARPVGKTSDEQLDELPCKFRTGDRVFAKVGADPPWPAQVDILLYEGTTLDMYHVTFYGTLNSGYVMSTNIWPYSPETILKYGRKGHGHGCPAVFKQAMEDIENEKLFLIAEPLEFPSKERKIMKGKEGESGADENVKEDAGELTGEETVDDASDHKLSAERQHGSSTVESPNKSSSSKTDKISVPVSPAPTPSEKSENSTSISLSTDNEVSDQDFGSTEDILSLGLGASPTPSSGGALPLLEKRKQRPFMMNDFRSHSQSFNSPPSPSAFGPGMTSSVHPGWNNNYGPASEHNYQPYPPVQQNPNPFRFNPPPYCNYNTATAHVHSGWHGYGYGPPPHPSFDITYPYQRNPYPYQPHYMYWGPRPPPFAENPTWLEPGSGSGPGPLQSQPLPPAVRTPTPMLTLQPRTSPGVSPFRKMPLKIASTAMMPRASPSSSPSPSNITSSSGHKKQVQLEGVQQQEAISAPILQQPEVDEQEQQLLSGHNPPASVLRTSIRNRIRAAATTGPSASGSSRALAKSTNSRRTAGKAAFIKDPKKKKTASPSKGQKLGDGHAMGSIVLRTSTRNRNIKRRAAAAVAAAAAATNRGTCGPRRALAKSVKSRRPAANAAFIKNRKNTTAAAAKINRQKLRAGRSKGSVSMKRRQGIARLYNEFTLDSTDNAEGDPKTRFKCIVVGCEGFSTRWPNNILKHIRKEHLKGNADEWNGRICVHCSGGEGKDKNKRFMCNFQDCRVKTKDRSNMAKHTHVHLKKTVDCSIKQCEQKFLYTDKMREHVERDH